MKRIVFYCVCLLSFAASGFAQVGKGDRRKAHHDMALKHAKQKSFLMGWTKDEAGTEWACFVGKHKVTFTYDFYMDSTLVTQADYLALMHLNPSAHNTGNLQLPVEKVTWYDAVLYCNERSKRNGLDTIYSYSAIAGKDTFALDITDLKSDIYKNGYRLPTNAEYEYTERAHTKPSTVTGEVGFRCVATKK